MVEPCRAHSRKRSLVLLAGGRRRRAEAAARRGPKGARGVGLWRRGASARSEGEGLGEGRLLTRSLRARTRPRRGGRRARGRSALGRRVPSPPLEPRSPSARRQQVPPPSRVGTNAEGASRAKAGVSLPFPRPRLATDGRLRTGTDQGNPTV